MRKAGAKTKKTICLGFGCCILYSDSGKISSCKLVCEEKNFCEFSLIKIMTSPASDPRIYNFQKINGLRVSENHQLTLENVSKFQFYLKIQIIPAGTGLKITDSTRIPAYFFRSTMSESLMVWYFQSRNPLRYCSRMA